MHALGARTYALNFRCGTLGAKHQSSRYGAVMEPRVTWPELMAATSLAADTGMGLPLETGLATCLVSMRLADALGLDTDQRRRAYHLSMLQHIGCTAASATVADVV